ncbi:MAG: hypothetical protein K0R27_3601 [Xanthobacteraceae bacterium]|jgi:hypothetical protein|nr:hypothetical protein [Xanthobacteraceae bacterium]
MYRWRHRRHASGAGEQAPAHGDAGSFGGASEQRARLPPCEKYCAAVRENGAKAGLSGGFRRTPHGPAHGVASPAGGAGIGERISAPEWVTSRPSVSCARQCSSDSRKAKGANGLVNKACGITGFIITYASLGMPHTKYCISYITLPCDAQFHFRINTWQQRKLGTTYSTLYPMQPTTASSVI